MTQREIDCPTYSKTGWAGGWAAPSEVGQRPIDGHHCPTSCRLWLGKQAVGQQGRVASKSISVLTNLDYYPTYPTLISITSIENKIGVGDEEDVFKVRQVGQVGQFPLGCIGTRIAGGAA